MASVNQNIIMENREKIKVSGVNDVESFNDNAVVAKTVLGRLIIKGTGLKVNKLNLENFELCVEGFITYIEYAEKKKKSPPLTPKRRLL